LNKNQYLSELQDLLKEMDRESREELLYDYKEHFDVAKVEGRTETEVAKELGSPKVVARELLADYKISKAEKHRSVKNIVSAVVASLSLGFLNSVFIIGPVVGIFGLFVGCFVLAIALSLSPLIVFGSLFFDGYMNSWLTIFSSFILCSLGVMLCIGLMKIGKFLYTVLIRYIKFNVNIVKGVNHS
jgi:uncharacterized membrane protein